jgi:hypothetical protein
VGNLTGLAGGLLSAANQPTLATVQERLIDNFVALYIAPNRDRPSLVAIGELLRVVALLQRIAAADATLEATDSVPKAFNITLALPAFFRVPDGRVRPVGIADLLVVKQHIARYELGEIARIENVLKGESRKHSQKHTLVNERTTTIESETTTEKVQELTSTDKVDIKNEVENTLKEDFNLKAGVSLGLSGTGYEFKANFDTAYDRSSSQSSKFASDVAKDVTQRASNKVTTRVRQQQITKITETFDELEDQGFENKSDDNTSGIYQWVNKVYEAQLFNFGPHLLFDLMVPEPAAFVLAAVGAPDKQPLTPPPPFTISPLDITSTDSSSPNYYPKLLALYEVTGVEPPPPEAIVVAKAIATAEAGGGGDIQVSDTIQIVDGYKANGLNVEASFYRRSDTPGVDDRPRFQLAVGSTHVHFDEADQPPVDVGHWGQEYQREQKDITLNDVIGQLGVTIQTVFISRVAVNLEIKCSLTDDGRNKWKLQTYEKIADRYLKLKADYDDQIAARQFRQVAPPVLSHDPDTNRLIERTELKKSCISILIGSALTGTDDVTPEGTVTTPSPPPNPAIKVPESLQDGPRVRFFEQAFEWDKIGYVFYPYYWARSGQWFDKLSLTNADPLFESFLKAGYARVVIPVRTGFEEAIIYFLISDKVWLGGALPSVTDPTYLPITEEIKEQTDGPDGGIPVGNPWEFRLPTQLIKLRKDDQLPTWTRQGNYPPPPTDPWTWTPGTLLSIAVTPASASIKAGSAQQYTAIGTFSDGSIQDLTATAEWSTSKKDVADVSNSLGTEGQAKGLTEGTTNIRAAASGVHGEALLTVFS